MDDIKEVTEEVEQTVQHTEKAVAMNGRSFDRMIDDVEDAWEERFGEWNGEVIEVFEKYFIAEKDRSLWKIPYSRNGEMVEFGEMPEWEAVKKTKDYVAKHLTAIKAIGEDEIGAYGMLWGDGNNKDYHGEYFTPNTAEIKSVFEGMGAIPFLFDHGMDGTVKSTVIGKVTEMEEDEIGLWFKAKITEHEAYKKLVKPLIDQRKLFPSSGVLPAAKRVKNTGEITRWPMVEMTGTHRPAEYRMLDMPISELNKHYKSAGLPELNAEAEEPDYGSEKERLERKLKQQELEARLTEFTLETF
jgi:hypothetical protein